MKKKDVPIWFPLYVDKWIFGSTRLELNPDQRSVFVDLMALAAKDNGFIRANPTTPYPPAQLAGLLVVTESLLIETIQRCIDVGKIERTEFGTLRIPSWDEYQLNPKYRSRITTKHIKTIQNEHYGESGSIMEPSSSIMEPPLISFNIFFDFDLRRWNGIEPTDIDEWKKAYPALDITNELDRMAQWLLANPEKRRMKKYRRFIVNWLSRQQDRGGRPDYYPRNSMRPAVDPNVGRNPKRKLTHDEWQRTRDTIERNVRAEGMKRLAAGSITNDEYERRVAEVMAEWDRDHPEPER